MEDLRVGPFVRAIRPNGVAIWTEWNHPCEVTLMATCEYVRGKSHRTFTVRSRTVTVGGRYYALSQLNGLQPATWYNYRVGNSTQGIASVIPSAEETNVQCFRTLDLPDAQNTLRLAYGSCRKLSAVGPDALSAWVPG